MRKRRRFDPDARQRRVPTFVQPFLTPEYRETQPAFVPLTVTTQAEIRAEREAKAGARGELSYRPWRHYRR